MPQPAGCMAPFGHTIRARRCAPPNGRPRCPSSVLTWGREVTGDLAAAERREWLCVNGIGGFASGTIAGTQTRRYHGLLIAALAPPLGRTLLAAQVHDTLAYAGRDWALGCARWASGIADPAGYRLIERFRLDGTRPVWTYACADALVEKRVWMEPGANTTYVRWERARPDAGTAPPWIRRLVLAADQFLVRRPLPDDPDGATVIAGYHWFGDWGRDTMIALPGLTLATGRPELARKILTTFARFVDRGMLPNRFPDGSGAPEYNTADATLWYVEALRAYHESTGDDGLLKDLYLTLESILAWHRDGTRYGIRQDPADGLLAAGEPGVQLTWMDAKVGDWVVTPRIGKPVEINALWYNALVAMAGFARRLRRPAGDLEAQASRVAAGFERFWNPHDGRCFDVLDGPDGKDTALRPNQIFAVSLPASPLSAERRRAVVDACARHLLISYGLRSLAPSDAHYVGRYGGDQRTRDGAYHQGTAWSWLLGPFALAHFAAYGDAARAREFLVPLADHLEDHGLGSIAEIFDGDVPFAPHGCIAQAWSVAETLRAWQALDAAAAPGEPSRRRRVS